jgi:hypothetical protein
VPPIFQPEVAADAIVWAAGHKSRELHVGYPASQAVIGNSLAPGLVDRYFARYGYQSQQTGEQEDSDRPGNLWEPADGQHDFGVYGRFTDRARSTSWALEAVTHRGTVALAGAGAVALALGLYIFGGRFQHAPEHRAEAVA